MFEALPIYLLAKVAPRRFGYGATVDYSARVSWTAPKLAIGLKSHYFQPKFSN